MSAARGGQAPSMRRWERAVGEHDFSSMGLLDPDLQFCCMTGSWQDLSNLVKEMQSNRKCGTVKRDGEGRGGQEPPLASRLSLCLSHPLPFL